MKVKWNALEWIVFCVSCLLVAGVLGYLAVDAWTIGDAPPDLVVTVGPPVRGVGGWRVPVTVENLGDAAAEEVRVGVVSHEGGTVREQAELLLPYVPRQSRRRGWVSFLREPAPQGLNARPLGYSEP